ncbi:MAG: alpha-2-macroglobulin family protein, partial [Rhodanobacter sp.]
MSRLCVAPIARTRLRGAIFVLLASVLLAACNRNQGDKPALQGTPAGNASVTAPANQAFALVSASADTRDSRAALVLRFNRTLAAAQTFDKLLAVTGPNGEVVEGSWSLDDDGTTLRFPFVQADTRYAVQVRAGMLAADGHTLGHDSKHDVYSGNLPSAVAFASHGSVLPARGTRGLPLVSVNVQDADVEFFRVHADALTDLFCAYPRNGQRSSYDLDHEVNSYNTCNSKAGKSAQRNKRPLTEIADSVYANHYTLGGEPNERTVTYLPVQHIKQLAEPGVYVAVVKAGGTFKGEYDTATFFVSDLGLHLRVYRDNALLHVASLRDGTPVSGVAVEIRDGEGRSKLK